MKNILIRSGKNPFQIIDPITVLEKNILGTNSGNLIYAQAMFKILDTKNSNIDSIYKHHSSQADMINEKYDAFVIPLANAFRVSFEKQLIEITKLIKKLKIPVIIAGVGAQSSIDYDFNKLKPLHKSTSDFVKAVLDKSATIGVRGAFTGEYLNNLGFKDVDVIGCPSMFKNGSEMNVIKKTKELDCNSKISINISPYVKKMGDVLKYNYKKYPNLIYIPQDNNTLNMQLWGFSNNKSKTEHFVPIYPTHPIFKNNQVRFFIDPVKWINYLSKFEFSFGTRIHGNITSLLAGTPAVVLAHDSRTRELVEYFDIPHQSINSLDDSSIDANTLYKNADYSKMISGHKKRFNHFINFCNKNGLKTIFSNAKISNDFENKINSIEFPKAIESFGNNNNNNELISYIKKTLLENNKKMAVIKLKNDLLNKKFKSLNSLHRGKGFKQILKKILNN